MTKLCRSKAGAKIAIAYWGKDSIKLLRLNPRRGNVKLLCCLRGGKSDPDIIGKFRSRARQHDNLHAKVIWTPRGALVSSANASSNGMPEEENSSDGLIEAGVYVQDAAMLRVIEQWFDAQYKRAKPVTKADLAAAEAARSRRIWRGSSSKRRRKKQSLIEALKSGGKLEFGEQRIAFLLCKNFATRKEDSNVRKFTRVNSTKLEKTLKLPHGKVRDLTWYCGWNLPTNTFLIACDIERNRISTIFVDKTFDIKAGWKVKGMREKISYALMADEIFNYKLSRADKKLIRARANELWKRAKGDSDGRVINIIDAAPILLGKN